MEKEMPYSDAAEIGVLSCLLQENSYINLITLTKDMFYFDKHRKIFEAMTKLKTFDLLVLDNYFGDKVEEVGGLAYLGEIQISSVSASHIKNHEKKVKENYWQRQISQVGYELYELGADRYDLNKALEISDRLSYLKESNDVKSEGIVSFDDPFTWGSEELDGAISPINKNYYYLLAGESGTGKTAYTFFMAKQNAKDGHNVMFISLEMSTENIINRVCRDYAGINKKEWRDRKRLLEIEDKDFTRKVDAFYRKKKDIESIKNLNAYGFGDGQKVTIENILKTIEKENPDIAFVDCIKSIDHNGKEERASQINITKKCEEFCKVKGIPIVLLHHFNKGQNRSNAPKQSLDDFSGAKDLTNGAGGVMQVWRQKFDKDEEPTALMKSELTVIEMKDRSFGSPGIRTVYFDRGDFSDNIPKYLKEDGDKMVKHWNDSN